MLSSKLDRKDFIAMGLIMIALLTSCVMVSAKKVLWNDELYSWYLLSDGSFLHMWEAFADKINNTPPLYFLLGWFWGKVFSTSELSLRLFSSVGFCAALVLIWAALRRSYAFWPVALALGTVFCTSSIFFVQNSEARMYGLFVAAAAWCFFLFDRICREEEVSIRLLAWNFLAHAALINTHLHGSFYSGAILVAFIVYGLLFSSIRPRVYLSVILSWLTFLIYLPAFLIQADAGKPRSWLPEPLYLDLTEFLFSTSDFYKFNNILMIILILVAGQVLSKKLSAAFQDRDAPVLGYRHLLIFGFAMLAVPIGVLIISKLGKPVFFPRYLIPTSIGFMVLFTHLFHLLYPFSGDWLGLRSAFFNGRLKPFIQFAPFLLLSVFFLNNIYFQIKTAQRKEDEFALRGKLIHNDQFPDLPIAIQSSSFFNEYYYNYTDQRHRYFYILDEEAASVWASGSFTYQEYKHLEALRRNYPDYFDGHIIDGEAFLDRHDRFLVFDYLVYDRPCPDQGPYGLQAALEMVDLNCPQWLEMRVLNNPDYSVSKVDDDGWSCLLLVEKKEREEEPQ